MAINYILLLSRQGKVRLAKWFTTHSSSEKAKITHDVTALILARKMGMCAFVEYKDTILTHRRYASLHVIASSNPSDNHLLTLEILHRYVEALDAYFGDVCELDIIFGMEAAYAILDELMLCGEMQESSKKAVVRAVKKMDLVTNEQEIVKQLKEGGFI